MHLKALVSKPDNRSDTVAVQAHLCSLLREMQSGWIRPYMLNTEKSSIDREEAPCRGDCG